MQLTKTLSIIPLDGKQVAVAKRKMITASKATKEHQKGERYETWEPLTFHYNLQGALKSVYDKGLMNLTKLPNWDLFEKAVVTFMDRFPYVDPSEIIKETLKAEKKKS